MATFPRTQAETIALVQLMIAGFTANPLVYPAPPETPVELTLILNTVLAARDAAVASAAATAILFEALDDKMTELEDAMKTDIRYAENTVDFDNDKLMLIGWSGRRAPSNQPPNQPRVLEVLEQGSDWVSLDWKNPVGGARVAAYKIQRRELPGGEFIDVGTALPSEAVLQNQPKGKDLEYRVIAINSKGDSIPSNTVAVVL